VPFANRACPCPLRAAWDIFHEKKVLFNWLFYLLI
jgi:hypothetical protein